MKVNLNWRATVTLTEDGRRILENNPHPGIRADADGKVVTQLWCLMNVFGPHMTFGFGMGSNPFVGNNIEIEDV